MTASGLCEICGALPGDFHSGECVGYGGKTITYNEVHQVPPWIEKREESSKDMVNHPAHYAQSPARCPCGRPIECIDVVRYEPFNTGNAMKYLWRYRHKNGIEDLKKAIWYIQNEIKKLEEKQCSET